MDLPNSTYLYTLALIAVGFVGFSAIVLILRQSAGTALSPLDTIVARLFMARGFTITYLSMLPMLLAAFDLSHSAAWRISSALAGVSLVVMHLGYQLLRARITREPTPLHLWFYTGSGLAFGLVLLANSVAVIPTAVGAIYVAVVTLDMIQASIAFVQHFGFMIDQLGKQAKGP
jgi:hypothetical protein